MVTKAMAKLKPSRRRWITKHASENCGVGKTLVEWKQQTDALCPRCDEEEDTTHVLRCQGTGACAVWNKSMLDLTSYLSKSHTMPAIQHAIITCLQRWRKGEPLCLDGLDLGVQQTVINQNLIGWKNLLEGLPSKGWYNLQAGYYSEEGEDRSTTKWMTGLLLKLNNLGYNQWDHRNEVKHNTVQPRHKLMEAKLDWEITQLLLQGRGSLPAHHRHHFRHSLTTLLAKPLDYRQAWLQNVLAAKDCQEKIRTRNMEATLKTGRQHLITNWTRTGRAS
jgi:hypothetical protein